VVDNGFPRLAPKRRLGAHAYLIYKNGSMTAILRGSVVGLMALFASQPHAGAADEARNLVAKLKASLSAIETLQGTYRTYFSPKTHGQTSIEPDGHTVPGAIAGRDDLVL
jgi:hypothetical protein